MTYSFTKMQGCGNDYIYIDCFSTAVADPGGLSKRLSKPHFGIGADGVILIEPSNVADAKMRIFNADGSEGKMCGNGVRCVGKYLYESGHVSRREVSVETLSGIKTLKLALEGGLVQSVTVDMGPALLDPLAIPVRLDGDAVIGRPVQVGSQLYEITCVSMGNPHCVIFCDDPDALDISAIAADFAASGLFPEGVNIEFVRWKAGNRLQMRVFERGSGETLACGTGACASAVAALRRGFCDPAKPVEVQLKGGTLLIEEKDGRVWMTGPAETVFTGEVTV